MLIIVIVRVTNYITKQALGQGLASRCEQREHCGCTQYCARVCTCSLLESLARMPECLCGARGDTGRACLWGTPAREADGG